jgi:ArsR family transcriptional regulator
MSMWLEAVVATRQALPVIELTGPPCCPGGLGEPLDRDTATELAALLKAVADPARLQLLSHLKTADGCEACVCDLTDAVGLSQATVSHHLKVLVDAGILTKAKRGYWTWYSVIPSRLNELAAVLV